jgi:hypothetical protein
VLHCLFYDSVATGTSSLGYSAFVELLASEHALSSLPFINAIRNDMINELQTIEQRRHSFGLRAGRRGGASVGG